MSKYTLEPWIYDSGDGLLYEAFVPDRPECCPIEISHEPNARRIVACVNACAGISTNDLERGYVSIKQGNVPHMAHLWSDGIYRSHPERELAEQEELVHGTHSMRCEAVERYAKLRAALDGVIDFAEDWHGYYCEMWGNRRKEQQDAMLGAILNARAALAEKGE